jgi:predicted deacylase
LDRNSDHPLEAAPTPATTPSAPGIRGELVIGGQAIAPGKRVKLEIPVARLPTGTHLSLPITVIHGRQPGPRLWLSAAIHGDELNGVDIIRRVVQPLKPKRLSGTVIAVPVVNVFGLLEQSRYLPDRRDLNRSFPAPLGAPWRPVSPPSLWERW